MADYEDDELEDDGVDAEAEPQEMMTPAELAAEIYAPAVRPKPTRQVVVAGKDAIWTCDHADMGNDDDMAKLNDGYRYYLLVMDVFTRYAWAVPCKSTQTAEAWAVMKRIMQQSGRKPTTAIWSDQGFKGAFSAGAKAMGLTVYHAFSKHKAAMAERLIRTIGSWLWQDMTAQQTRKWTALLPDVMKRYNNSEHKALDMTPAQASSLNAAGQQRLWTHQYGEVLPNLAPKLEVGDWVRISRLRATFEKSIADAPWSREVFRVAAVSRGHPPMYELKDWAGEEITGKFYAQELRKTRAPELQYWEVKDVLAHRNKGKSNHEILVTWLGVDANRKSWIPAASAKLLEEQPAAKPAAKKPAAAKPAAAEPQRVKAKQLRSAKVQVGIK